MMEQINWFSYSILWDTRLLHTLTLFFVLFNPGEFQLYPTPLCHLYIYQVYTHIHTSPENLVGIYSRRHRNQRYREKRHLQLTTWNSNSGLQNLRTLNVSCREYMQVQPLSLIKRNVNIHSFELGFHTHSVTFHLWS